MISKLLTAAVLAGALASCAPSRTASLSPRFAASPAPQETGSTPTDMSDASGQGLVQTALYTPDPANVPEPRR